jgi:hypothetical protein
MGTISMHQNEFQISHRTALCTSNIPTVGRSVMSHTKNVTLGGTAGKEVVIFFSQSSQGAY